MKSILKSWNSFSSESAGQFLKTFGTPSKSSNQIIRDLIPKVVNCKNPSILDLGCGNGVLFEYLKNKNYECNYTGVDFSEPLIKVAREICPEARFICCDVNELSTNLSDNFDLILYSHVIEMLESPELSLIEARKLSNLIMIKFFEPPSNQPDKVELCEMDFGKGAVPYLRRTMSFDSYRLILSKIGCKKVDIYKDISKDQVHILYF